MKILEPEETWHIILPPMPNPQAQLLTNEKGKAWRDSNLPKAMRLERQTPFRQAPPDIEMLNEH